MTGILRNWRQRRVMTRTDYACQLQCWYHLPVGRGAYAGLKSILQPWLNRCFGYYGIQLGSLKQDSCWLRSSPLRYNFLLQQTVSNQALTAVMAWDALAIEADSVDAVLMFHSFEAESRPHIILREVERVLITEGQLILVGFNPWSFIGFCRLLNGWKPRAPWYGRYRSVRQMKDWLNLLGFEVLEVRFTSHQPPWHWRWLRRRSKWLDRLLLRRLPSTGGIYAILAKKSVARLTSLRPAWSVGRATAGQRVVGSSTRGMNRGQNS